MTLFSTVQLLLFNIVDSVNEIEFWVALGNFHINKNFRIIRIFFPTS